MRYLGRAAVLATALLAAMVCAAATASAAKPVQLSLGDSWGAGVGAVEPQGGYVPRLHAMLQEDFDCSPSDNPKPDHACRQLELVNLSVGGATTPTLIANQLPAAVELLEARNGDRNPRNDVEFVTIHIGGNDVTNPIVAACLFGLNERCLNTIQTEFAAFRNDLDQALSALRAADPDVRILLGTYDNPIPSCVLGNISGAAGLAAMVLEGAPPAVPQGLHDVMREVAAEHGVEVVSVYGQLGLQDWVGGQDCLHPDDSGYAKVAAAFHAALN